MFCFNIQHSEFLPAKYPPTALSLQNLLDVWKNVSLDDKITIIFSTHYVSKDSWTGDKEEYFKKYGPEHVVTLIQTTIYGRKLNSENMSCWLAGLFNETESTIWFAIGEYGRGMPDGGYRLHMQPLRLGCCETGRGVRCRLASVRLRIHI